MTAVQCPSPEQLRAFHLGDLPESSLDEVAEHLDVCPRCETLARQLDTQVDPILKAIRTPDVAAGTRGVAIAPPAPRPADATGRFPFLTPSPEPGDMGRLANYRILRVLGTGGMGFVFHAEDLMLRRPVALKVMKPDLTPDADGWQRFAREARIMASISHRHLVTVFQAGQENGVIFLAMELLEGETLATRLDREGTLNVPDVLRLGREIATGLAAIHRQHLVHRDIKPDNIWLEAKTGSVKILDFGLARCVRDDIRLTHSGIIMGTPSYMSPEQAKAWDLDERSDLFSLGALLYRAASGREPFSGTNTMTVLAALAVATPRPLHELNPTIPRAFSNLVSQLLAKDPNARPATAEAVLEELQAMEAGRAQPRLSRVMSSRKAPQPERSWPSLPAPVPVKQASRRGKRQVSRRLMFGSAAAGLVVLTAIAIACWRHGTRRPVDGPPSESGYSSSTGGPGYAGPAAGPVEPINPADDQRDVIFLSDLMPAEHENWFPYPPPPPGRPARRDDDRPPVRVRGKASPHGIFMHGSPPHLGSGPSSITYRLSGLHRTFEADISINDGPPHSDTPIVFSVYGDDRRIWQSKPVTSQQDLQHISVPVEKVDVLKIEIRCADREVRGAHAVWLEPRLLK